MDSALEASRPGNEELADEVADPQHFECLATQVIAPKALKVLSEDIGMEVALGRLENEKGDSIAH